MKDRISILTRGILVAIFLLFQLSVFSQEKKGLDTIPPPPPPHAKMPKVNWEALSQEEKLFINSSKNTLNEIQTRADSLLNDIVDYLISTKQPTNFQILEAARIIYQIPGEESLLFLIKNIDVLRPEFVGGVHQQWKNFPFYVVLVSDNQPNRLSEIVNLIFKSNILDECKINGEKLKLYRSLIEKVVNYEDSLANDYIKLQLNQETKSCSQSNLQFLLSEKYPNLKYSIKIEKYINNN